MWLIWNDACLVIIPHSEWVEPKTTDDSVDVLLLHWFCRERYLIVLSGPLRVFLIILTFKFSILTLQAVLLRCILI